MSIPSFSPTKVRYVVASVSQVLSVDLGDFKFPSLIPSEEFNLPNVTPFLLGEDKRLFLDFARKMLRWEPEERPTAKELYNDPWLNFRS